MLDNDFMLKGETSKILYKDYAKNAPIYDYHCHLSPKEIYENEVFNNISEIWLKFDHYKWRAMRFAGIPEKYITGDEDNLQKFKMWAKTCEKLVGSPLYAWANMELKTFFDINETLKESNAERIYNDCNKKLKEESLSPIKFIMDSNVKLICTTDDPVDSLEYHKKMYEQNLDLKVLPTFRPDKVINILNKDFIDYLNKLSKVSSIDIKNLKSLLIALNKRIDFFHDLGCKLSDHSFESLLYVETTENEAEEIFNQRINGKNISLFDAEKYKCYIIKFLAEEYCKKGWAMQLHIGAMRNNNEEMLIKLGPDAGFDIMNDFQTAPHLSKLLNEINKCTKLPKTILYTLNPKDNIVMSTLPHCFSEDGIPGKVQFGAAWWFNDHKEGIYEHLKSIGSQGMLSYFLGMLTDSRSFLSYPRHDYFRRILCSYVGNLIDDGEFENDKLLVKEIIEGVCYKNVLKYLELEDLV